jgi:hypothetical protein
MGPVLESAMARLRRDIPTTTMNRTSPTSSALETTHEEMESISTGAGLLVGASGEAGESVKAEAGVP